jgi:tyrosyl-tRNA synthetase
MYGKLMSISDELMWKYYTLLTDLTPEQIAARGQAVVNGDLHPKRAKSDLAMMIVRDFHDAPAAEHAAEDFERRSRGDVPDDVIERPMLAGTAIEHLLLECGLAKSGSDASRKVQQGAVRINGEKYTAVRTPVDRTDAFLLQVGRQIVRVVVLQPADVLVTTMPRQSGEAWIIMQNKGRVDVEHATRDSALARAREVAAAHRSRVFVFERDRLRADDTVSS